LADETGEWNRGVERDVAERNVAEGNETIVSFGVFGSATLIRQIRAFGAVAELLVIVVRDSRLGAIGDFCWSQS
jgi:hypothetical protein